MLSRAVTRAAPLALFLAALPACKKKVPPAPPPAPSAAAPAEPCPAGQTHDPSHAELSEATTALKDKQYDKSRKLLDELLAKHPHSATVRVWRGDAALFDDKMPELAAADEALRFFAQAEKLRDQGCALAEMEAYYLRFDSALAYLRKDDAKAALRQLEILKKRWPDSPEVFYNSARAHCLDNDVARCVADFEQALVIAKQLRRPKFLRAHHSVDDWIRRSQTQSELGPLRKDARYAQIVQKAGG